MHALFGLAIVGALAGPGAAEEPPGWIRQRIAAVFALVPRYEIKLAIPLSRRALAYRAAAVDALPFQEVEQSRTAEIAAAPFAGFEPGDAMAGASLEEGSSDLSGEAEARLPHRRPETAGMVVAQIDLIAGEPNDIVWSELAAAGLQAAEAPADEASETATEIFSAESANSEAIAGEDAPMDVAASALVEEAAAPAVPALPVAPRREDCIAPTEAADADGDFRRNREALSDPALCIVETKFNERKRPWIVQTVDSGRPGPLWAVMHDDEAVAFDNAVYGLKTYGGVLMTLETGGKRNQDGIDPNRNFSADGTGCAKVGGNASPRFTALFRDRYEDGSPILALHNNHDGRIPTGGLGHVSMDALPKSMRAFPAAAAADDLAGDHTLVLLAATDPDSAALKRQAETLARKGINVVVEPVDEGRGDCSLSNDTVLAGYDTYINVTVDDEDAAKQRQIVDAIMASLAAVAASR